MTKDRSSRRPFSEATYSQATRRILSALGGMSLPRPALCFWLDWARNSGRSFFQSILNHSGQALQSSECLVLRRISSTPLPIPGGWLADRWGRRKAFLTFLAAAVAGYLVYLLSPSWPFLFLGLALAMTWQSMGSPAIFATIGDALPKSAARWDSRSNRC